MFRRIIEVRRFDGWEEIKLVHDTDHVCATFDTGIQLEVKLGSVFHDDASGDCVLERGPFCLEFRDDAVSLGVGADHRHIHVGVF